MRYFVNVSKNGRHFFSTDPENGPSNQSDAIALIDAIRARFTEKDGYTCDLYCRECWIRLVDE